MVMMLCLNLNCGGSYFGPCNLTACEACLFGGKLSLAFVSEYLFRKGHLTLSFSGSGPDSLCSFVYQGNPVAPLVNPGSDQSLQGFRAEIAASRLNSSSSIFRRLSAASSRASRAAGIRR